MSDRQIATMQFWIYLGTLVFAAIASYFVLSEKANMAIAQIEELRPRVSAVESKQESTSTIVIEIRNDVKWLVKKQEGAK